MNHTKNLNFGCRVVLMVLVLGCVGRILGEKNASPAWGPGLSQSEFSASLEQILTAIHNKRFHSLERQETRDDKKLKKEGKEGKRDYEWVNVGDGMPVTTTLYGAHICRFRDDGRTNVSLDRGYYDCLSTYPSNDAAYTGWKEAAKLLRGASGDWRTDTLAADDGKTEEQFEKSLQQFNNPARLEFRNENGILILLALEQNAVTLTIDNRDVGHYSIERKAKLLIGVLDDKRTDDEFGGKLKTVMQALGSFNPDALREKYDLKRGQGRLMVQLFCGELYDLGGLGGCNSTNEFRPCKIMDQVATYACDWYLPSLSHDGALDVFISLSKKIERVTGDKMMIAEHLDNPQQRAILYVDRTTRTSISLGLDPNAQMHILILGPSSTATAPVASASTTINEIRQGAYSPLPSAQATSSAGGISTTLAVRNNTPYALTMYFSGPTEKSVVLAAQDNQQLTLPNGQYRIAAKVSSPSVLPFYGEQIFAGGDYSEVLYIGAR